MKRVGLLVGQERSFPEALIAQINRQDRGVVAEMASLGPTPMDAPCPYDVLIDRISHEVPYYQSYLKNALLQGTCTINNPFWRIADDKFFDTALAQRLGVAVPKTVRAARQGLRRRRHARDSLRQPQLPARLGRPRSRPRLPDVPEAALGRRLARRVRGRLAWKSCSPPTTRAARMTMILQEAIRGTQYVRCDRRRQEHVLPALWDPRSRHFERYAARRAMPPLTDAAARRG